MYDVRDNNGYTVRKLADGNCWMTTNLNYTLGAGTAATGSYNNGSTFSFTPTSCATDGACAMNGNTVSVGSGRGWVYTGYAAFAGRSISSQGILDGSICPAGWRLPVGDNSGDKTTYALLNAYGIAGLPAQGTAVVAKATSTPISFAGELYQGGARNGSSSYVTSYTFTDGTARRIWYGDDSLYYRARGGITLGASVRCVNN